MILDRKNIYFSCFAVILAVMAFSTAQGLTYPLLSSILVLSGASTTQIAINAACTPLGIVVSSFFITKYAIDYNRKALICLSVFTVIVILWFIAITPVGWFWSPLRFLLGIAINVIYVLSEITILQISPPSHRARLIGAYTAITNIGYAIGPLLLLVSGNGIYKPILLLTIILFFSLIPIYLSQIHLHMQKNTSTDDTSSSSVLVFIRTSWILVLCYASTTLFDNAFMSLLPVYGISFGMDRDIISLILSLILIGGVVIQLPCGLALDKWPTFNVTLCIIITGTICFIIFKPQLTKDYYSYLAPVALGASVFSLQTIALNELGGRYAGRTLAAGNAAFAMMWGVSGVIGVPLSGFLMDNLGAESLIWVTGTLFSFTAILFLIWIKLVPIKIIKTDNNF
ncbi:MFS transporter [Brenneria corticis]|uniref:Major facilitator superfamily (MFS) profile domain-containing protein n=1 Tax=Brenneria corticis TaxID=2173106 RepID=A0A2U1U431_9GAMM|nr:MFS transporter [Brenneria sp. CFCC 11842]PWC16416.1 hypothetical protein DDT56_10100 [Brenneria sp. CFCC 11842]